jgi:hypothetical protein
LTPRTAIVVGQIVAALGMLALCLLIALVS